MIVNYGPASRIADDEILVRLKEVEDQGLTITERLSGIEIDIDSVETKVSEAVTTAAGTDQKVTTLTQDVDSITARVEKVEGSSSDYTEIKATLDGLTITTENGKTIIDGGNIDASNLNLSGAITFGQIGGTLSQDQLDASTQEKIDNADSNAGDALDAALQTQQELVNTNNDLNDVKSELIDTQSDLTQARDIMADWINGGGSTYIDGSCIKTNSLYSRAIHLGGTLTVYTTDGGTTACGHLGGSPSLKDGSPGVHFLSKNENYELAVTDHGARFMQNRTNQAILSDSVFTVQVNGVKYIFTGSSSTPAFYIDVNTLSSGSAYLGMSNSRWKNVYTTDLNASGSVSSKNGVCTTSDKNLKNNIEDLPEKYVNMFDSLVARRYKMDEGESGRYHVGFVAQEVEKAMTTAGIDSQEFGGFVIDKYEDENGDMQEKYMLRYDEFIGILTAKIKQLESRIEELEAK